MTNLKKGDKAPYFEGINQNNQKITLNDFSGKRLEPGIALLQSF